MKTEKDYTNNSEYNAASGNMGKGFQILSFIITIAKVILFILAIPLIMVWYLLKFLLMIGTM